MFLWGFFLTHRFAYKSKNKHNTELTSEVSYFMLKGKVLLVGKKR